MRDVRLVIVDCDGVLVDSERISNRVFCSMLNRLREAGADAVFADMRRLRELLQSR